MNNFLLKLFKFASIAKLHQMQQYKPKQLFNGVYQKIQGDEIHICDIFIINNCAYLLKKGNKQNRHGVSISHQSAIDSRVRIPTKTNTNTQQTTHQRPRIAHRLIPAAGRKPAPFISFNRRVMVTTSVVNNVGDIHL